MYIVGINAYHGDAAAVLVRDGVLVAAVEEERFRRIKHWAGFPSEAIRRCLELGGIAGSEVNAVAVSRDRRAHLARKVLFALSGRPSRALLRDRLSNARTIGAIETPLAEALGITVGRVPTIHAVEHHAAHLASAFFVSPFDRSAVCAIDGFGDFVSTSMAVGRDASLNIFDRTWFPHSLGVM